MKEKVGIAEFDVADAGGEGIRLLAPELWGAVGIVNEDTGVLVGWISAVAFFVLAVRIAGKTGGWFAEFRIWCIDVGDRLVLYSCDDL